LKLEVKDALMGMGTMKVVRVGREWEVDNENDRDKRDKIGTMCRLKNEGWIGRRRFEQGITCWEYASLVAALLFM
jgi:hypothetical protein